MLSPGPRPDRTPRTALASGPALPFSSAMARIPLEDDFTDVLRKAQRGHKVSDKELAARAGITPENLAALQAGRPLDAVLRPYLE